MVGVIQVTGTSISVLVVDKFGRRKLLILSELFIAFAFCMLGSFFFVQVKQHYYIFLAYYINPLHCFTNEYLLCVIRNTTNT